ncbi:MAG: ImmA/IrrE family metallo-endopeptidase [Gemmataceae bacterium]
MRFEPLLSTAKLVKIEAGSYILMNTEAPGANQPPGTILDVKGGRWSDLAPPLRFTIAHEIAHTVFMKAGWDSNRDLFSRHDLALESSCSKMARVLLLPPSRLVREWEGRLFDIEHIKTLLKRFRVSAQAFILRIQLPDLRGAFDGTDGMLAFAREEEGQIQIVAYHTWGPLATGRFSAIPESGPTENEQAGPGKGKVRGSVQNKGLEGRPLDDLSRDFDIEAWLQRGERDPRPIRVVWRPGTILPCEIIARQIHSKPRGFLISIRVNGSPEPDSEIKARAEP